MKFILIDNADTIILEMLAKIGITCDYKPNIKPNELNSIINNYEGILLRSKIKIDKRFIDLATKLKCIGRLGSGLENIDVEYAASKNIVCFNSPEGNCNAVAEHAIGMLLTLFNRIAKANDEIRAGIWLREENRGVELSGKTIGIIGYGNTGSAFAKRLSGFDVKILAYDKYKSGFTNNYVTEASPNQLYNEADILSIHVPLTDETLYMVNDEFINKFKKNFYLINTARGKCVHTNDLVKNLMTKKILGVCLDVHEFETDSFDKLNYKSSNAYKYLLHSDNVILTPHIAGWTHESHTKLSVILAQKIIAHFTQSRD